MNPNRYNRDGKDITPAKVYTEAPLEVTMSTLCAIGRGRTYSAYDRFTVTMTGRVSKVTVVCDAAFDLLEAQLITNDWRGRYPDNTFAVESL